MNSKYLVKNTSRGVPEANRSWLSLAVSKAPSFPALPQKFPPTHGAHLAPLLLHLSTCAEGQTLPCHGCLLSLPISRD